MQVSKFNKDKILGNFATDVNGCWVWQGRVNNWGYGMLYAEMPDGSRRTDCAHRVSYRLFVADIPDGFTIDHLCRNTRCVNPTHLEAVTSRTNTMRSPYSLATINSAKTHCPHGHPYDDVNTGRTVNPGGRKTIWRWCRRCRADQARARRERTRALKVAS